MLKFLLYGNFWIAGTAAALVLGVQHYYNQFTNYKGALLTFFATLFLYNAHRLIKMHLASQVESFRHKWIFRQRKTLFVLSFLAAGGAIIYVLHLSALQVILGCLLTLVSLAYAMPIGKIPPLRDVSGLKIFLVAAVWVAVSMFFVDYSLLFQSSKDLIFIVLFGFVFLLTLPFDIRDVDLDGEKHLSLPYLLNQKQLSKLYVLVAFTVQFIVVLLFYKGMFSVVGFTITSLAILLSLLSCYYIQQKPKQHEFFFVAWVDGLIYVFALGLYLA